MVGVVAQCSQSVLGGQRILLAVVSEHTGRLGLEFAKQVVGLVRLFLIVQGAVSHQCHSGGVCIGRTPAGVTCVGHIFLQQLHSVVNVGFVIVSIGGQSGQKRAQVVGRCAVTAPKVRTLAHLVQIGQVLDHRLHKALGRVHNGAGLCHQAVQVVVGAVNRGAAVLHQLTQVIAGHIGVVLAQGVIHADDGSIQLQLLCVFGADLCIVVIIYRHRIIQLAAVRLQLFLHSSLKALHLCIAGIVVAHSSQHVYCVGHAEVLILVQVVGSALGLARHLFQALANLVVVGCSKSAVSRQQHTQSQQKRSAGAHQFFHCFVLRFVFYLNR